MASRAVELIDDRADRVVEGARRYMVQQPPTDLQVQTLSLGSAEQLVGRLLNPVVNETVRRCDRARQLDGPATRPIEARTAALGHQEAFVDGTPQRARDPVERLCEYAGEQAQAELVAHARGDAEHLLLPLGQLPDAAGQKVDDVLGDLGEVDAGELP